MCKIGYVFTDRVSGEPVYLFADKLGRAWLATGRWSMFRVRKKRYDPVMPRLVAFTKAEELKRN